MMSDCSHESGSNYPVFPSLRNRHVRNREDPSGTYGHDRVRWTRLYRTNCLCGSYFVRFLVRSSLGFRLIYLVCLGVMIAETPHF